MQDPSPPARHRDSGFNPKWQDQCNVSWGGQVDTAGAGDGQMESITEEIAIERLRQNDDLSLRYYAAWWLGRMRSNHPEAVPLLVSALRQRGSPDPGTHGDHREVARNAARALGKLGDQAAIPELLIALEDDDHGLREAAARSLGSLRAVEAIVPLCRRLDSGLDGAGAAAHGSARLQEPCDAMVEALGALGDSSTEVIAVIEPFTRHERALIRSAAFRALLELTAEPRWGRCLIDLLEHPQLNVRRAAMIDLGELGWSPALKAISSAVVENNFKLMALRGLLENGHRFSSSTDEDQLNILTAMDALL